MEGVEEDDLGITIDYSRDTLLTEKAKVMLTRKGFYKKYWEESLNKHMLGQLLLIALETMSLPRESMTMLVRVGLHLPPLSLVMG